MAPLTNNKSTQGKNGSPPFVAPLEHQKASPTVPFDDKHSSVMSEKFTLSASAETSPTPEGLPGVPAESCQDDDARVSQGEAASTNPGSTPGAGTANGEVRSIIAAPQITGTGSIKGSAVIITGTADQAQNRTETVDQTAVAEALGTEIATNAVLTSETPPASTSTDTPVPVLETSETPPASTSTDTPVPVLETEEAEMTRLDYSKISARLYQGSAPTDLAYNYARFSMIVLCAEEYQPELPNFRGKLIRAGFNDTAKPTQHDVLIAGSAAEVVFRELVEGGRVLVTCMAGRNRSGLVCGLVLGRKMSGEQALATVRESRENALTNPTYAEFVRRGSTLEVCKACSGKGQVARARGAVMDAVTCPKCGGSGKPAPAPAIAQAAQPVVVKGGSRAQAPRQPGLVASVISAVFQRHPDKPRGAGRDIKPGVGRGYFGRARTDRTPKKAPPRGAR